MKDSHLLEQNAGFPWSAAGMSFIPEVLGNLNLAWFSLNPEGLITAVSENLSALVGQPAQKAVGKKFTNFLHPDDRERVMERFAELEQNIIEPFEYRITFRDNDFFYVRTSSFPEFENDRLVAIHGFILVTDSRKNTSENERLKQLVRHLPVMVNAIDEQGNFVVWNHECERVTGYSADEVIRNPEIMSKLYPDPELYHKMVLEGNFRKDYRDFVAPLRTKDGAIRTISWTNVSSSIPIPGWQEWAVGLDVTDKTRDKQKLIEQERLFQSVFALSRDGMVLTDINGNIFEINPSALEIIGLQDKEVAEGLNLFEKLGYDHELFFRQFVQPDNSPVLNKISRLKRDEGDELVIDMSVAPAYDHTGDPWYLTVTLRNITEKIKQEQELKTALEKAEQSDRLKTAFLTNMSHEIRTPMNAIVGFANILAQQTLPETEQKEYASYIEQSSDTLLHLINDILDISKIEAGEINLHKEQFLLNDFMKSLIPVFEEHKKKYQKGNLDIQLIAPENNEPIVLYTDKTRLQQIITNLVTNAIKFTAEGFVKIRFYKKEKKVVFSIEDSGPGIPPEEQKVVFTRFRQVDNSLTRKSGGAGLGLAICRNLVNLLGGKISLESAPDRGSCFIFNLPVQEVENIPDRIVPLSASEHPDWSDKSIIVAEDEIFNYVYVEQVLKPTGIKIIRAGNGAEAVDFCRKGKLPDLIILDLRMPVMDGFSALTAIRELYPEVPAIAMTAFSMSNEKQKCLENGFNSYLAKPVRPVQLLNEINRIMKS
ncbi:MAG: PAS domain S-box protein [Chlorobi bacterium]|nr:PAS domain S-box protein [Chlorobiota bacterium]